MSNFVQFLHPKGLPSSYVMDMYIYTHHSESSKLMTHGYLNLVVSNYGITKTVSSIESSNVYPCLSCIWWGSVHLEPSVVCFKFQYARIPGASNQSIFKEEFSLTIPVSGCTITSQTRPSLSRLHPSPVK